MEIIGLDLHQREGQLSITSDDGRLATAGLRLAGSGSPPCWAAARPHPARGEHPGRVGGPPP